MGEDAGKKLLAELIGTFTFIFIGAGAIVTDTLTGGQVGLLGIALAHGVALAIVISSVGHISGGHINPAVTIGFMATGRMNPGLGVGYIIAQLVGGALGGFALKGVYASDVLAQAQFGTPLIASGVSISSAVWLEILLTFFLVMAIFGTAVDKKGPNQLAGFGIGSVLIFDIMVGGPLTGASMNPARTFGPAFAGGIWADHWVYWVGPVIGALAAALLYTALFTGKDDSVS